MVDRTWTLEDLMEQRHPEIPLYVVFMKATPDSPKYGSPEFAALLREHLLYWWELEDQGKLFGAGPMDLGEPGVQSMAILHATSRAEAEELVRNEPMCRAGARVHEIHTWQLNEGLSVPFAKELRTE